eukprot:gnl/TRDRNA2_/TRDRNA2_86095_c0_seq1.p1 gnl/TRDRNA2_/TRDRNA2_86095_c0~~gnl/TRDRNA2_/TRDRNA2_86095_c0_seq1.p1  ORF type:complete len:710 (+),score=237.52 gnl/TRDRNA2_/TRDRNA2_86095_c0_seq1:125-2254(+)
MVAPWLPMLGALLMALPACSVSPVQQVISLMDDLQAKLAKAADAEEAAFKEFYDWCDNAARDSRFQISSANKEKEDQSAAIGKAKADAASAVSSIEELTSSIAANEEDLKEATKIREREHADFVMSETELVSSVETLDRSLNLMSKKLQKSPALLQKKMDAGNTQALLATLRLIVDAASFPAADKQSLIALVQNQQKDTGLSDDDDAGAPAAAAYESHGSNILDILEDLKGKSEAQLAEARQVESAAQHNFQLTKQSLVDQITADEKDLAEAKTSKAQAAEDGASAKGALELAEKDLKEASAALETVSNDCMTAASDHEISKKGRNEEMAAIAKAKEIILEATGGAAKRTYSLIQVDSLVDSRLRVHDQFDLVNLEVVTAIKRLAKEQHSPGLAQLAVRISASVRESAKAGQDPFAKVKTMIVDMINKLQADAKEEASKKAYCDEEMQTTSDKKSDLTTITDKLTAKIDKATSTSETLKGQVAEAQKEMASIAKSQVVMDKARNDEHAAYVEAKADLEKGISGVTIALQVLRDYYEAGGSFLQQGDADDAQQPAPPATHSKSGDAGGSIMHMLEVCVDDFTKNLAQIEEEESEAVSDYENLTQENKLTSVTRQQDVKYKTQEYKSLDKTVAELSSDHAGVQTELDAVLEYADKLNEQCVGKPPETYEERKARRDQEIQGLKEAIKILEGGMFIQRPRHPGSFLQRPHNM